MRVALVGCGLIGRKRAAAVRDYPEDRLVVVVDIEKDRAVEVGKEFGAEAETEWKEVVGRSDLEAVIVATPNKFHESIACAALESEKHVLCEKPLGRTIGETERMVDVARQAGKTLKAGFNHRHHPAVLRAHDIVRSGELGPPLCIRAMYGHGGRSGYDREWRGSLDLAGGGELLDQGIHLLDLCRWFLGDFTEVFGMAQRYYWDVAPLEDNAFAILKTASGQIASVHTSWTQWKNRFSFEVLTRDGYVRVEGLGGSYGKETLVVGRRKPESGPPIEQETVYEGRDRSWSAEWEEFRTAINQGREPLGSGIDGLEAVRLIEALYESSRSGNKVTLLQRGRS